MSGLKTLSNRLAQQDIYQRLRTHGSPWLKLHVLWADRQLVVLNKPPGIICQMGDYRKRTADSPQSIPLDPVFADIKRWITSAEPCSVHRLDKPTTGCLIVALNPTTAKSLSQQFELGTVSKTYLALVRGGEKSFYGKSGQIKAPILYNDGRGDVSIDGKYAHTEWELVNSSPTLPISLLRLHLITGNKHQLRIHLAKCLKTPILGDEIYSKKTLAPSITEATQVPPHRLFLHASEVSFFKYSDCGKRNRLGIRAPIPKDFERICRDVGISLPYDGGAVFINDRITEEEQLPDMKLWKPYEQ